MNLSRTLAGSHGCAIFVRDRQAIIVRTGFFNFVLVLTFIGAIFILVIIVAIALFFDIWLPTTPFRIPSRRKQYFAWPQTHERGGGRADSGRGTFGTGNLRKRHVEEAGEMDVKEINAEEENEEDGLSPGQGQAEASSGESEAYNQQ